MPNRPSNSDMAFVFAHMDRPETLGVMRRIHLSLLLLLLAGAGQAATYTLAIEPSDSSSRLEQLYRPLADYLSQSTGETFEIQLAPNYLAYWQRIKKGGAYDFIIDSPHLTDYRIKHQNFLPLMRANGDMSFSVVTLKQSADIKAEGLVGKNVASLGPPSLPYLLFHKLYPNPMRQPKLVAVDGASEAIDKLRSGEALAAVIPTSVAASTDDVIAIAETERVPNLALSAAPTVPAHLRTSVVNALGTALSNPEIATLLQTLGVAELTPVNTEDYVGQAALLEGMWGF